jgi:hypothetical protein
MMATLTRPQNVLPSIAPDNTSDYGSEIDDATALELLSQVESQPLDNIVLESIEEPISKDNDDVLHRHAALQLQQSHRPADDSQDSYSQLALSPLELQVRQISVEVEYDESNRVAFTGTSPPPCFLLPPSNATGMLTQADLPAICSRQPSLVTSTRGFG